MQEAGGTCLSVSDQSNNQQCPLQICPCTYTANHALLRTAGQTVLVLGAAGGVGVAAVQISKVLGAKVVAVARGAEKAKLLKDLGADAVIDTSANHQGVGAGPSRQADPSEEGYGALGGPGAQQGPALRDLIKQVAPEGLPWAQYVCHLIA